MTRKEIQDEMLKKVSGGSYAQCKEIMDFFDSIGYAGLEDNIYDDNDLDLFLMDVLSVTKLSDYSIMTTYHETGSNVYTDPDGHNISHEEFMKRLRAAYGK